MMLSVKQLQHAKPGKHADGRGLYLLVKPGGSRSWVLRVQHRGRRRDLGLGSAVFAPVEVDVPIQHRRSLTLAQAREKARLARELVKAGLDPSTMWRPKNESPSFTQAAEEYHRQISKGWRNGKHSDQWLATLRSYAFPGIGNMPVDVIGAPDIHMVLAPIWMEKAETARRVRQRIAAVLDYAHGKGWRDDDAPMRAVNQLLGGLKQPRSGNFAAMPYREIPAFIEKLRKRDQSVGNLALQFLIHTAARSGELRHACWRDVDFGSKEWRVPPSHTKTGKLHIVPLSRPALRILKARADADGQAPDALIFPGLKGPMSDATLAKVLRTSEGGEFTVHGFRSAFRDWAADNGYADSWAEAALAHTNPNRIESAYRRTTFLDQRRDVLMPAWANFCGSPQPAK